MTLEIHLATAVDVPALADVAAATFELATTPGTDRADIDAFIGEHLTLERFAHYVAAPERALFLATLDGTPVGYTMLVFAEPSDSDVAEAITTRPTVELSKVYARADVHGSGLAARMLATTLDHARERGAAAVWLGVNSNNPRANAFYEKHGFAIVGRKRFRLGDRVENDYVRELVL